MNALTGNTTGYGFAKDTKLIDGFDVGTKNTTFAPAPTKLRLGVSASLPVSAEFWDAGMQAYKEADHNGITW